jgi:hypothetical protein
MNVIFSFPILESRDDDTFLLVTEDDTGDRKIVKSNGEGLSELTVKRLKEKISEYEEAISVTKVAISLLK